jgi:hypothetical protein
LWRPLSVFLSNFMNPLADSTILSTVAGVDRRR